MSEEKGMGVFGSVDNRSLNSSNDSKVVNLETFRTDDDKSDTIYNLLFREYDEETN